MNNVTAVQEYQDVLKAAALAFLERHQCEHLADDQRLISRAVRHLVTDYDVLTTTAAKAVFLAFSDLVAIAGRQQLDMQNSLSTHAVIVDPVTGTHWSVPVSLIYERIINVPERSTYRFPRT